MAVAGVTAALVAGGLVGVAWGTRTPTTATITSPAGAATPAAPGAGGQLPSQPSTGSQAGPGSRSFGGSSSSPFADDSQPSPFGGSQTAPSSPDGSGPSGSGQRGRRGPGAQSGQGSPSNGSSSLGQGQSGQVPQGTPQPNTRSRAS